MKILKTILFLFLLAIATTGCEKDCPNTKEVDFNLNNGFLKQTVWEGTFVSYDKEDKTPFQRKVNLFFKTESMVEFTVTYNNNWNTPSIDIVKYTAVKNMLTIEVNSQSPQLAGDWLLIEGSKDKLILGKDMEDGYWNHKMSLTKKY